MINRTLWLHVGIPKTSTTAYQSWMRKNAGLLKTSGVVYPDRFGADNDKHNFLVRELRHSPNLEAFEQCLADCHTPNMLLSDEGLTNHLDDFKDESLQRFRELTKDWNVKIILVTRNAASWTRSYHKQCVLNPHNGASPLWGTALTCEEIKDHPRIKRLVDHDGLARDLKIAFGAEFVYPFIYEDTSWFHASLDIMRVNFDSSAKLPHSNQSLPDWSIELLRRVNSYTDLTEIRNQWKIALQSYLGTNHTILTNLTKGSQKFDRRTIEFIKSIQHEFLPAHSESVEEFLTYFFHTPSKD